MLIIKNKCVYLYQITKQKIKYMKTERTKMRNVYMDLSIELDEIKTRKELCIFLPKVLPFIKEYSDSFLCEVLIEEIRMKELEIEQIEIDNI